MRLYLLWGCVGVLTLSGGVLGVRPLWSAEPAPGTGDDKARNMMQAPVAAAVGAVTDAAAKAVAAAVPAYKLCEAPTLENTKPDGSPAKPRNMSACTATDFTKPGPGLAVTLAKQAAQKAALAMVQKGGQAVANPLMAGNGGTAAEVSGLGGGQGEGRGADASTILQNREAKIPPLGAETIVDGYRAGVLCQPPHGTTDVYWRGYDQGRRVAGCAGVNQQR